MARHGKVNRNEKNGKIDRRGSTQRVTWDTRRKIVQPVLYFSLLPERRSSRFSLDARSPAKRTYKVTFNAQKENSFFRFGETATNFFLSFSTSFVNEMVYFFAFRHPIPFITSLQTTGSSLSRNISISYSRWSMNILFRTSLFTRNECIIPLGRTRTFSFSFFFFFPFFLRFQRYRDEELERTYRFIRTTRKANPCSALL